MKGIDTNVLVRYIVQDDLQQSQQASHFIASECSVEVPGFINVIVLCECVWVFETAYNYPKQTIAKVIEKILRIRQFCIQQPEIVWKALYGYQNEGADFADHCIANLNAQNGCEYTATFDKKAARLKHFKGLE